MATVWIRVSRKLLANISVSLSLMILLNRMRPKSYTLAHETKADIVKANYFYHSKDGDVLHEVIKNQKLGTSLSLADDTSILLEEPGIWSAIYRRKFLQENKINFRTTPGASYQDTGFHFKSFYAAKRTVYTDEAYLHYRVDNASSSVKSLEKINYIVDEYAEIEEFIKKYNLSWGRYSDASGCKVWRLPLEPSTSTKEACYKIRKNH